MTHAKTDKARDHAAILPTSVGPAGAIISEPAGPARGGLILLQGGGPPCRAGVNSSWARLARELAGCGVAVLRFDFTAEGESTMIGEDVPREPGWRQDTNLTILRELAPWFRERIAMDDLLLAGSCHGARVALEFAAEDPRVSESFLIVPYLWSVPPDMRPDKRLLSEKSLPQAHKLFDRANSNVQIQRETVGEVEAIADKSPLEESVVETCRKALKGGTIWMLIGEGDSQKPVELKERVGPSGRRLNVEVIPEMIIHPVTQPEVQELVSTRLIDWVSEVLPLAPR